MEINDNFALCIPLQQFQTDSPLKSVFYTAGLLHKFPLIVEIYIEREQVPAEEVLSITGR